MFFIRILIEKRLKQRHNVIVAKLEWCNGNTWVSKTFVEGSSPSSPANKIGQSAQPRLSIFVHLSNRGEHF